jgi:nicotinamidase/pyrazinamidase
LIVVDVQNDFCPGGALPVPHGDEVIAPINALIAEFTGQGQVVVYTKDHHPAGHHSFKINHPDGLWPPHCVQNTPGGEFHAGLKVVGPTFYKAFTEAGDSYSGFGGHIEPNAQAQTLADYLKAQAVTAVTVVGLALDYCVRATAIDAHQLGLAASVDLSATRAVNVQPDDGDKAIAELKLLGITVR